MMAAIVFSSWRVVLWVGVFGFVFPNGVLSDNFTMFPKDFANKPCNLANNMEGVCVYAYLCTENIVNIAGKGTIDLRFIDVCEDYFLKCCSRETPCLENTGTCVSANNCGADLDDSEYKQFKETDECNWSGYVCCPQDEVGKTRKSSSNSIEPPEEGCVDDSVCVPDDQCTVNPDGDGLLQARSGGCASMGHTCCPRNKVIDLPETGLAGGQTNSIEQSTDPCSEVGGKCVPENSCNSTLEINLRISQCDELGQVCCMQDATDGREQFIGRSCSGGKGNCSPRKKCKGTTYMDTNEDCGGLACCATLDLSQTTPRPLTTIESYDYNDSKEGQACFNNNGKCTAGACMTNTFKDRKKECGGLKCCANVGQSTTPTRPITTSTTPFPEDDDDSDKEGQPCSNNNGECGTDCAYRLLEDKSNDCGSLNCCATSDSTNDRSCSSIGGTCASEGDCQHKIDSTVEDCDDMVCCVRPAQPEPVIRDCGYRNANGVKFETVNANEGESEFGEFPWMVAIMTNEKDTTKFICGGSLIDPEVVLTTAECVKSFKRSPNRLIVRAGEWDMGTTSEPIRHHDRQVTKIKSHPDFRSTTLVNNIALLFLDDKYDQDLTINTVCLPPQDFALKHGEVTATGWGSTPQKQTKFQQILKKIELSYSERQECEQILRKGTKNRSFKLHRSFICAVGEAGTDTCRGDAGSPIVYQVPDDHEDRYYAIGMVSWGIGCGRPGVPAAYTDIGYFRDWIDTEVEQEGLGTHYYTYIRQEDLEETDF